MKVKHLCFGLCIMVIMRSVIAYENTPVVRPAEVLPPELLQSLNHRVREVEVRSGIFHFYLESNFGDYYIDSMGLLRERVREIMILGNAISHTGGEAADLSGKLGDQLRIRSDHPLDILRRPVKSAKELAGQVASRLDETLGGPAPDAKRDLIYGGSESLDPVMALHKRNIAGQWQLDVYSTNPRVQAFLDAVARERSAGNISAGTPALNRLSVKPLPVADPALEMEILSLLKARSAGELKDIDNRLLAGLKIDDSVRTGFLQQPVLSPRHKTRICEYLGQLADVGNLSAFLVAANRSRTESEALAYEHLAMMIASYNKNHKKLHELQTDKSGIDAVTVDNELVHFVVQDMIYWNKITEQFYDGLLNKSASAGYKRVQVVTSGMVTSEAEKEMRKRRIDLLQRDVF